MFDYYSKSNKNTIKQKEETKHHGSTTCYMNTVHFWCFLHFLQKLGWAAYKRLKSYLVPQSIRTLVIELISIFLLHKKQVLWLTNYSLHWSPVWTTSLRTWRHPGDLCPLTCILIYPLQCLFRGSVVGKHIKLISAVYPWQSLNSNQPLAVYIIVCAICNVCI